MKQQATGWEQLVWAKAAELLQQASTARTLAREEINGARRPRVIDALLAASEMYRAQASNWLEDMGPYSD